MAPPFGHGSEGCSGEGRPRRPRCPAAGFAGSGRRLWPAPDCWRPSGWWDISVGRQAPDSVSPTLRGSGWHFEVVVAGDVGVVVRSGLLASVGPSRTNAPLGTPRRRPALFSWAPRDAHRFSRYRAPGCAAAVGRSRLPRAAQSPCPRRPATPQRPSYIPAKATTSGLMRLSSRSSSDPTRSVSPPQRGARVVAYSRACSVARTAMQARLQSGMR
jgi:hypothetical protein